MLPLLPQKSNQNQLCHDVNPLIREIFQDVFSTFAPPPSSVDVSSPRRRSEELPSLLEWRADIKESQEIRELERKLKCSRVRELIANRRSNLYRLEPKHEPLAERKNDRLVEPSHDKPTPRSYTDKLLKSDDLLPPVELRKCPNSMLWMRNMAAARSQQFRREQSSIYSEKSLRSISTAPSGVTSQSVSVDERGRLPRCPHPRVAAAPAAAPPLHMLRAVPPRLNFVNCFVGRCYTKTIRLINVSKYATRLSITPPRRSELDVQLGCASDDAGARYAGGVTVLHVHFTPKDVREIQDELRVRARGGAEEVVPIRCYVEPPVLHVSLLDEDSHPTSIANVTKLTMSNTSPQEKNVSEPTDVRTSCISNSDTLDLGATLVGSVWRVDMELYSSSQDVSFFILSEDAWINWSIENMTQSGTLLAEPFVLRPTYFPGGIVVPGNIWCAPECFGIHVQSLRILSTTTVIREIDILVDALYFQIGLVRVVAEEKNFDICAEEDTRCEQYLNLGLALPGRQLTKTIEIVNDSPVAYTYYWAVRPWGVCLCECEDDVLGPIDEDISSAVVIEPSQGKLLAQSTCAVDVMVPDVGQECGTRRAIIMLVLKNIPRRSFPNGFNPSIVSSRNITPEYIPGTKDYTYEACDIICGSVEVWWRVEPLKVIVRPPRVRLPHSHRVPKVEVEYSVTRLAGPSDVSCEWRAASDVVVPPDCYIAPQLHTAKVVVPLVARFSSPANIQLVFGKEEFISHVLIERHPQARAPDLMPTCAWRGVVLPSQKYEAHFTVLNVEPHQVVCSVSAHRDGGVEACGGCDSDPCSCDLVLPRSMSIHPHQRHDLKYHDNAGLKHGAVLTLLQLKDDYGALTGQCSLVGVYVQPPLVALKIIAPPRRRPDTAELGWRHVIVSCDCVARFSQALTLGLSTDFIIRLSNYAPLAAFYSWQPAFEKNDPLEISICPSEGVIEGYSDVNIQVTVRGTRLSTRRVSFRTCALRDTRATNLKPLHLLVEAATVGIAVSLDIPTGPEGEGRVRMRVAGGGGGGGILSSLKSTSQLFKKKLSQQEMKASDSIFEGEFEEFVAEFKIKQDFKGNEQKPFVVEEVGEEVGEEFAVEEEPLECGPALPDDGIAENPDTINMEAAFPCIQFTKVPLRTVQERLVRINNDCELATSWTLRPTVFPRIPTRTIVKDNSTDKWAADCKDPGVCVQCVPCEGKLAAFAHIDVRVEVYVDTWGVYCEHLKYEMSGAEGEDRVEGSVDVWVQAAGSPLRVMQEGKQDTVPTVWFTQYESREEHRQILVRNVSHAPLLIHNYLVTNHHPEINGEVSPRPLPFRVLLRFQDTDPCECSSQISALETKSSTSATSASTLIYSEDRIYSVDSEDKTKKMGTGIILFLAPDYGHQHQDYYRMKPSSIELSVGEVASLHVCRTRRRRKICPLLCPHPEPQRAHSTSFASLPDTEEKESNKEAKTPLGTPIRGECSEIYTKAERTLQYEYAELAPCPWDHLVENQTAPPVFLLIEMQPLQAHGTNWHRGPAGTLAIQLHDQSRSGQLHLSKERLTVRLCAAALPQQTDLSVRKNMRVQNTGTGSLQLTACAESPWSILTYAATPALSRRKNCTRSLSAKLHLQPGAFVEVGAELCVRASDVVPIQDPYPGQLQLKNYMHFFQEEQLLETLILELLLEYPQLLVEPKELNIGVCTLGQNRKEFLSFTHTSRITLDFVVSWSGGDEVQLHPTRLRLAHSQRGVVYVHYNARHATATEGDVTVTATSASWCTATVRVCARADHDRAFSEPAHCRDYTDDIVM